VLNLVAVWLDFQPLDVFRAVDQAKLISSSKAQQPVSE